MAQEVTPLQALLFGSATMLAGVLVYVRRESVREFFHRTQASWKGGRTDRTERIANFTLWWWTAFLIVFGLLVVVSAASRF